MRELLEEIDRALAQGTPCVWCSVVETRGSTPQKPGASMLVFADGRQFGTLGGGCVEAEVKRQALESLAVGDVPASRMFTFDLDDNYGWDDGLICGGRMTILADPLDGKHEPGMGYVHRLRGLVEAGAGGTEAVALRDLPGGIAGGTRFLFDGTGRLIGRTGDREPGEETLGGLRPLAKRPRPYHHQGVAYLPILPRITLLIVGGGHVGLAVARLAADVDFDIEVLDDRETYAGPARFPMARKCMVGDIGRSLAEVGPKLTASTYALIVTRGHAHDEEALFHLATTQAGYVGLIGSKRKIKLIFEDLLARGVPAAALERVHAPLGFAIGSQTVAEIAVSIVAELIAVRNTGSTIAAARLHVPVQ